MVFQASSLDGAQIISLIRALNYPKDSVLWSVTNHGLRLAISHVSAVSARAYIQANLFDTFLFQPPIEQMSQEGTRYFNLPMVKLLECTSMFNLSATNSISLSFNWAGEGHPLEIKIEENDLSVFCSLRTIALESELAEDMIDFRPSPLVSRVLFKSEVLKGPWQQLDMTSERLEVTISPESPCVILSTESTSGTSQIEFLSKSEAIESLFCERTVSNAYRFNLLQPCYRALTMSHAAALRMNAIGVLSMQFMISCSGNRNAYLDFVVAPFSS